MRLSAILMACFGTISLVLILVIVVMDKTYPYAYILVPFFIAFTLVFFFIPQVDWWQAIRKPPLMPKGLERSIGFAFPFYQKLNTIEKKRFRDRTMLWMMNREFHAQGLKNIPEEVKATLAAYAVMMTFGKKDYLLHAYQNIAIYPHPFPSPNYEVLHNSETNDEDGAFVFNVGFVMKTVNAPLNNYCLPIHEYVHAWMQTHPQDFKPLPNNIWDTLSHVRGFNREFVEKYVGLAHFDNHQPAVEAFLTVPQRFRDALPELFEEYVRIFNLDPIRAEMPVIHIREIGENPIAG